MDLVGQPALDPETCPEGHPSPVCRYAADLAQLQSHGITAVLNLQTQEDFLSWNIDWDRLEVHYRQSEIEILQVPVRDFDEDNLRRKLPKCVDALNELLNNGLVVYVHCSAGMNRSPSTIVAYLHWIEQRTLDEAMDHVMSRRACNPYREAILLASEDRAE